MERGSGLVAPLADLPSLTVRWDGLVVAIDATTLNAVARKAVRNLHEIEEILVEPENGRLGLTVRVRKGIRVLFRSHLESLRFKDGYLGFAIVDLKVFGVVPIPSWILRKIVDRQPPGRAFFYSDERVVVLNLNPVLPPELSVHVRDVVCENGEIRFVFGPCQYRLDRVIEEMGRDPFEDE
ncbi:MAG: hypothetical protein ACHQPI_13080 [Thermoanaerobaculia bacterium]